MQGLQDSLVYLSDGYWRTAPGTARPGRETPSGGNSEVFSEEDRWFDAGGVRPGFLEEVVFVWSLKGCLGEGWGFGRGRHPQGAEWAQREPRQAWVVSGWCTCLCGDRTECAVGETQKRGPRRGWFGSRVEGWGRCLWLSPGEEQSAREVEDSISSLPAWLLGGVGGNDQSVEQLSRGR